MGIDYNVGPIPLNRRCPVPGHHKCLDKHLSKPPQRFYWWRVFIGEWIGVTLSLNTPLPTFCRTCENGCAVLVQVEDGIARGLTGDRNNPVYEGYTCIKGRVQPALSRSPRRLLHPQRRNKNGSFSPITSTTAVKEIAELVTSIVQEHGPESVAVYRGTTTSASTAAGHMAQAFLAAIKSPLFFTTNTIDKGGRNVAQALLGNWMAPRQAWDRPQVGLLLGINPFLSHQGFPFGPPARWLEAQKSRGMKLIVIDPRRTEVAAKADCHLQARPGTDALVLASFIRLILKEQRHDQGFVNAHTSGLGHLAEAVEPFTPELVAELADVPPQDLIWAARTFAQAARGFGVGGTGPQMTTEGVVTEYLLLCLESICGHYLREGETVPNAGTLLATPPPKAQAAAPKAITHSYGRSFRQGRLRESVAGPPTAALPDEILDGSIKVLISLSGNPVAAIPGKRRVVDAMRALDLLVQIDPWMSETAQLADYIVAPTVWLEAAGMTYSQDYITRMAPGYGLGVSYAQYAPAVVAPPEGSDVVEEWAFFYLLAKAMGLQLSLGGNTWQEGEAVDLDMSSTPTHDDIMAIMARGSRIPLSEVKEHRGGSLFPEPRLVVEPPDPGWTGRLELANPEMLEDLRRSLNGAMRRQAEQGGHRFRLISRRSRHAHNSSVNVPEANRGVPYNPAYLNPQDLEDLGVQAGDLVEIYNQSGQIVAVAGLDSGLRPGVVSMSHSYGQVDLDQERDDPKAKGSSTNWLLTHDEQFDRYTGQPLMTNVPVSVRAWHLGPQR